MRELLRFTPVYQERVWGGRALEGAFSRTLPPDSPIGESWEIVDRSEVQSRVVGGPLNGRTLRQVIEREGAEVMGPRWPTEKAFPILVKWLDCRERLSLQVHPPAKIAAALGGEPKTENWYIAHTEPGAKLIVGLKRGVNRAIFERAIIEGNLESCVHSFRVAEGDSILVRSGQVHAIDAGNLILEIQQNSDTTYRVFDWGRPGLNGKPRQLHVSESLKSIDWEQYEASPVRGAPTSGEIAQADEFAIRRVVLAAGERAHISGGEQPRIVSVVSGSVRCGGGRLGPGDNALVPFAGAFTFSAENMAILLVTENFA